MPAFDQTIHDIGLGEVGDPQGYMLVGAYSKSVQRKNLGQITGDFGGGFDLIVDEPKKSRWSQDDFSGGMYQWRFDQDPAMFNFCSNMLPQQLGRSVISVPPFVQHLEFDPETQADPWGATLTRWPKRGLLTHANFLMACFGHGILKYTYGEPGSIAWGTPGLDVEGEMQQLDYDHGDGDGMFWVLIENTGSPSGADWFKRFDAGFNDAPADDIIYTPTGTEGQRTHGFALMGTGVVCQVGNRLWTFKVPIGSEVQADNWVDKGRFPGRWIASCDYNTLTYILVRHTDFTTHLVAFDGTDVFPVCSLPYNFMGKCMAEYAGRLFIGGSGTDLDGGDRYAELHEVTGSSTRLVRTFSPETYRATPPFPYPAQIRHLLPMEGMLFMAEDWGGRCLAYDVTTDAFFGGPENPQPAVRPIWLAACRERLIFWGDAAPGDEMWRGLWRVATENDDIVTEFFSSLYTSDFTIEPAMRKRWEKIVVMSRYGVPDVQWSQDMGDTWSANLAYTTESTGDLHFTTYDLTALDPSRSIRFLIFFTIPEAEKHQFRELLAYTVSFEFEESEDRKHAWVLTINGSDRIEGRDNSDVEQDTAALRDQLWGWADAKTKLDFRDFDGNTKKVTIEDITEQMPLIGPDAPSEPEAFYALSLLEV